MNEPFFSGVCTALVTPFINGDVNYPLFIRLIERQIDAGIEALVICGTTGEAATLTTDEKLKLIHTAKETAGSRCKIIAGTGANSTANAITLNKAAERIGADGLLVVSPYYNKATPDGLIAHYTAISSAVHVPVILYNVPSRTGMDISVDTCKSLSKLHNIVGIKEASSDITKTTKLRAACGSSFSVWSGNDEMIVPILSLGGVGAISVVSNVYPEITQAMTKAALDGDFDTASSLQIHLYPLISALFRQVNPVPVKAAMKIMGYDCGSCRLPLTDANEMVYRELEAILKKE